MFRSKRIVGKKYSVVDYKAYTFYRDQAKHRNKKHVKDFVDHGRIINKIYQKVADSIAEYEGGVYFKEYFYIIPQLYPEKKVVTIPSADGFDYTMNSHTGGRFATILFVNLLPGKKYEFWSMDGAFFKETKSKVSKKLKEFRPKFTFSLRSLLKASR